jgi:hypothetical protein
MTKRLSWLPHTGWLAQVAPALLALALLGCGEERSCGPGTVLVGGKCIVLVDAIGCGPGTSAAGGLCVADVAAGPDTSPGPDALEGSDTTAETDVVATTDALADTDVAVATDVASGSDTAAETDAAPGTDTTAETDVAEQTDAAATTDASPTCEPNCLGRFCGPDGCGGSCGSCGTPAKPVCNELSGQCEATCVPQCTGKNCGDNGCGGSCGDCTSGTTCSDLGTCVADAWTCDKDWYATADACDCDCGAPDPDCDLPFMPVFGCDDGEVCSAAGICASKAPSGWTCDALAYAGQDYCNCGCGAVDPDCAGGLPVQGCQSAGATCSATGTCVECVADCTDKECGNDGCGGFCGSCLDDVKTSCNGSGKCVDPCAGSVKLVCETAACGDDGCGGSCGSCDGGETCTSGQCLTDPVGGGIDSCKGHCGSKADSGCSCVAGCEALGTCCDDFAALCTCKPACDGKSCGPDGCGGTCGSCGVDKPFCSDSGICEATCAKKCDGKQCGPDGCGGQCGTCSSGETCGFTNQCVPAKWKCDQSYYADGLACDCGCGAGDPDCNKPALSVFGCPGGVSCSASGTCSATFCDANSDCGAGWCMGAWAESSSVYSGICGTPLQASAAPGTPCEYSEECASNLCLDEVCRTHCGADTDCASSERCLGLPVVDGVTGGIFGYSAACDLVPGTAMSCASQAACDQPGEDCIGRVDPLTLGPRYLCELVPALPAAGASCLIMACPDWQLCVADKTGAPICTAHCPAGNSDCPSGYGCVQRALHNAGTPDTSDDPQVPVCVPN